MNITVDLKGYSFNKEKAVRELKKTIKAHTSKILKEWIDNGWIQAERLAVSGADSGTGTGAGMDASASANNPDVAGRVQLGCCGCREPDVNGDAGPAKRQRPHNDSG